MIQVIAGVLGAIVIVLQFRRSAFPGR